MGLPFYIIKWLSATDFLLNLNEIVIDHHRGPAMVVHMHGLMIKATMEPCAYVQSCARHTPILLYCIVLGNI